MWFFAAASFFFLLILLRWTWLSCWETRGSEPSSWRRRWRSWPRGLRRPRETTRWGHHEPPRSVQLTSRRVREKRQIFILTLFFPAAPEDDHYATEAGGRGGGGTPFPRPWTGGTGSPAWASGATGRDVHCFPIKNTSSQKHTVYLTTAAFL